MAASICRQSRRRRRWKAAPVCGFSSSSAPSCHRRQRSRHPKMSSKRENDFCSELDVWPKRRVEPRVIGNLPASPESRSKEIVFHLNVLPRDAEAKAVSRISRFHIREMTTFWWERKRRRGSGNKIYRFRVPGSTK